MCNALLHQSPQAPGSLFSLASCAVEQIYVNAGILNCGVINTWNKVRSCDWYGDCMEVRALLRALLGYYWSILSNID